jgi:hypothetical protein
MQVLSDIPFRICDEADLIVCGMLLTDCLDIFRPVKYGELCLPMRMSLGSLITDFSPFFATFLLCNAWKNVSYTKARYNRVLQFRRAGNMDGLP